MNKKPTVKLVKRGEHKASQLRAKVQSAVGATRWSKVVQSWVIEFQKERRVKSLPAFDSLFK